MLSNISLSLQHNLKQKDMKNLTAIQKERVEQYKKTLNKNSKFYNEDLQNFISNITKETASKSKSCLSRVGSYSDKKEQSKIKKEIEKMDKSGMFDIKKMHAANSLD